ncbi:uncharacterized protein LOC144773028 isoform X1 [Lissotriton helveticus]
MAYYAEGVDQWADYNDYAEFEEVPYKHQMEEQLVEALDTHFQCPGNRALIKALQPFVKSLQNYGKRKFKASLGESSLHSSVEVLSRMAYNVTKDHGYSSSLQSANSSLLIPGDEEESSPAAPDISDSEQDTEEPKKESRINRFKESRGNPIRIKRRCSCG